MDAQKDLPLPQTDLPLPEKEITSGSMPKQISKNKWTIFIIIALAVLFATLIGGYLLATKNASKQIACTLEAKICPDGSSVGRTGPKCEFSKCPGEIPTLAPIKDWKTYTNSQYNFSVDYPKDGRVVTSAANGSIMPGQCGNAIIAITPTPTENNVYTLLFDNFFAINIVPYDKSISEYIKSVGADKFYDIHKITGSGADEAVWIEFKTGSTNLNPPPLSYVYNIYRKDNNLFFLVGLQNPGNFGGCVPENSDFVKNNWSKINRFRFNSQNPTPTCRPRPACLDTKPRCMIAETSDMCPPTITPSQ